MFTLEVWSGRKEHTRSFFVSTDLQVRRVSQFGQILRPFSTPIGSRGLANDSAVDQKEGQANEKNRIAGSHGHVDGLSILGSRREGTGRRSIQYFAGTTIQDKRPSDLRTNCWVSRSVRLRAGTTLPRQQHHQRKPGRISLRPRLPEITDEIYLSWSREATFLVASFIKRSPALDPAARNDVMVVGERL